MRGETKIFGLTGNIGAGKSTVAWMFEELGVATISSDHIAHEALSHPQTRKALFERYGRSVLLPDKMIDRTELAEIVFDSPKERKFLESIIHPFVRNEIEKRTAKLAKEKRPFVVVEIPLLFEAGWEGDFDAVIVVTSDEKAEVERCREKLGMTEGETRKRIAAQFPQKRKADLADAVIDNSGSLKETKVQVRRLYQEMLSGRFPRRSKTSVV